MKARYGDLAKARAIAMSLGGTFLWQDSQVDTYFSTKAGKLKLRQSGKNGSELLPYMKVENGGLKRSDYVRLPTEEPELLARILDHLLGTKLQVRKLREVYLIGNVRVHLDEVEELGSFLEFEAVFSEDTKEIQDLENRKVAELMIQFEVSAEMVFQGSYPDLLAKKSESPHKLAPGPVCGANHIAEYS